MSLYDRSNVKSQTRIGGSFLRGSSHQFVCWVLISGFLLSVIGYSLLALNTPQDITVLYKGGLGNFLSLFVGYAGVTGPIVGFERGEPLLNAAPALIATVKIWLCWLLFFRVFRNIKYVWIYCVTACCIALVLFIFNFLYLPSYDVFAMYNQDILNIRFVEMGALKFILLLDMSEFFLYDIMLLPAAFFTQLITDNFYNNVHFLSVSHIVSYFLSALIYAIMALFLHRSMKAAEAV